MDEARAAARDVDELADEVRIDARREFLEVQVDVVEARPELGGQEIAEIVRRQHVEIAPRRDERAARLRHLLAVHRQEAVGMHGRRLAEARALEHRRPEQRVEVQDVLADEVVQLRRAVRLPPVLEVEALPLAVGSRSSPCSRPARRARRRSTCPARPESRSRSTARRAIRPSREARPRTIRRACWRPRPAVRRSASTAGASARSSPSRKKMCSDSRSTGRVPDTTRHGSMRSEGE